MTYDNNNSGTLWQTANFNNPDAKCHYSGEATINGKAYKIFGRKVGKKRDFDIIGHGVKAVCSLSPVDSANENAPDFKGKTMIQGKDLEVAAWGKVVNTKHGEKRVLSLKFQPPYQRPESCDMMSQNAPDDDETPF